MKIIQFEEIDSTNSYLKREAHNLDDLSFCEAVLQTNGRGRYYRNWEAEKGKNLTFSLLIKDPQLINKFSSISLLAAYVISQVLTNLKIKDVSIKWPNDVYVNGQKICGILLESTSIGENVSYLVLGIGLNVNQTFFYGDFDATSIFLKTKKISSLETLKIIIYEKLINELSLLKENKSSYLNACRKLNYLRGKLCTATYNNESIRFHVLDINDDNSLLVEIDNKKISINSGEISLIRN